MIALLQIPTEVPHPDNNTPLDFSNPFELIVYIIIPVAMLLFYFFLRKKRKQKKNDDNNMDA